MTGGYVEWSWSLVGIFLIGSGVAALPWVPASAASRVASSFGTIGFLAAAALAGFRIAGLVEVEWFVVITALFVTSLSVVIQVFSVRQLREDARQRWFVCWLNIVTAGSLGVVVAPSVLWFAAAWTVVGLGLLMLLGMYRQLSQARQGVRRTATNLVAGDAALWAAVVVLLAHHGGDITWARLGMVVSDIGVPTQFALALLLLTAALARSVQFPFHTWLPLTLAAPTPVSAIMHAGIVNAATFLVIRFSGAISDSVPAVLMLFILGAATMLVGAAGYLVRPDLKGRLVASTTAQMGFMVMTLGTGAYAAAVFHLIGHGFYKSNLFLRSGTQISDYRRHGQRPLSQHPSPVRRLVATALAAAGPSTAIIATTVMLSPNLGTSAVILAGYGCVTGAVFLYPWLLRDGVSASVRALVFVATTAIGVAYAITVHAAQQIIGSSLPVPTWSVPGWALLPPLVLLALISLLPGVSADRWPGLYGLMTGLAGNPFPRVRADHPGRARKSIRPSTAQEIA